MAQRFSQFAIGLADHEGARLGAWSYNDARFETAQCDSTIAGGDREIIADGD